MHTQIGDGLPQENEDAESNLKACEPSKPEAAENHATRHKASVKTLHTASNVPIIPVNAALTEEGREQIMHKNPTVAPEQRQQRPKSESVCVVSDREPGLSID